MTKSFAKLKEIPGFNGFYSLTLPIPRGGFESFLDVWFIDDEARRQKILVETGPASVSDALAREITARGMRDLDYLIYTHIHLDHAGGAGRFVKLFPNVKVLAPEKGRAHLIDPSKLATASRASLGDLCDAYGEPSPVPRENIIAEAPRGLTVIDTPGHAPHHSSYIYELGGKRILFAGEAAGCWFKTQDGDYFMRPATPHKFFYDTAVASLEKLIALKNVDIVCFPHSGCSADGEKIFKAAREQMALWLDILSETPRGATPDEAASALKAKDPMLLKLAELPESVRKREEFFIRQSAKGYLGWIERKRASAD